MAFNTNFRFREYVDEKGERKPSPEPERIYGPVCYIGPLTVCAYALETPRGIAVIDTGYEKDGDLLPDNMRKLGLDPADIRLIFNTHWHWDHSGGNRRLVEISGAELCVHALDAKVLESGKYGDKPVPGGVKVTRGLVDGDVMELGGVEFHVYHTPGQTAGSISILATVDGPDGPCRALFSGDSTGFKHGVKEIERLGYPGVCQDYRRAVEVLESIEFDLFCGGHPHQVFREMRPDGNPFVTREEYLGMLGERHRKMEEFVAEHPKYLDW